MIVVAILIALLIAVSGGMIVAIYLIASTMLAGLSWVGLISCYASKLNTETGRMPVPQELYKN